MQGPISALVYSYLSMASRMEEDNGMEDGEVCGYLSDLLYYVDSCNKKELFLAEIDETMEKGVFMMKDKRKCKHCDKMIDATFPSKTFIFFHYMIHHKESYEREKDSWKSLNYKMLYNLTVEEKTK